MLQKCQYCNQEMSYLRIKRHEEICCKNPDNFFSETEIEVTSKNLDLLKSQRPSIQAKQKVYYNCTQCGTVEHLKRFKFFTDFVCNKCTRKNTCIEKYGTSSPMKSDKVKNKFKETVRNKTQEEIEYSNQKRKKTCLERYGVETACQNKEIHAKQVQSLLNRSDQEKQETRDKTKRTLIKKYGENYTEKITELQKQGCLKKYGVDNIFKSPDFIKTKSKDWIDEEIPLTSENIQDLKQRYNLRQKVSFTCEGCKTIVHTTLCIALTKGCFCKACNMKKTWIKNYGQPSVPGVSKKRFSVDPLNVQDLDLQELTKNYRLDQDISFTCIKCNQPVFTKLYNLIRKGDYLCKHCNIKETLIDRYGIPHPIKYLYKYDDQSFDSSWELALWIYAKDHNEKIEREPVSFEYTFEEKIRHYTPDFRYNGQLVEIKGSHFFDKEGYLRNPFDSTQDLKWRHIQQVASQNGVIYYSDNEIRPILDYIDQKYTKDYLQLFKTKLPFPYPRLSKNPNDYDILRYFHKSIYEASKGDRLSPLQAWQDKKIIKKTVLNRLKYVGKCTPRAVLQGLTVARIAPKVSVFKPNLAERLIKKYLDNFETIFDPFSGFSGRMLGATTCNKKYIGQDLNEKHVQESNEIIQFKQLQNCTVTQQDILTDSEKTFQNTALFTCPPYSDKEFWTDDKSEVVKTCDEWIDICLEKYKCGTYLFVVDQTEKYKDKIVETIENKSHFGKNNEYVILIQHN